MNPTITRLALEWLRAERRATADFAKMVSEDAAKSGRSEEDVAKALDAGAMPPSSDEDMAIAVDRVYHMLRGEIRWSECSPGDKAIWKGRMRDAEKFERAWTALQEEGMPELPPPPDPIVRNERPRFPNMSNYPTAAGRQGPVYQGDDNYGQPQRQMPPVRPGGPRLIGYRERVWWNYYDTLQWDGSRFRQARLFGNQNLGDIMLSNLEVPGQLRRGGFDSTFAILSLYASITDMDVLRWASDSLSFIVNIGDRPSTPAMFVRDLFVGLTLRRPLMVPTRQNVSVTYYFREPPRELSAFEVTFHIDGLETHEHS